MEGRLKKLDYVQNFKRETVSEEGTKYLYQVIDVVYHSETQEKLVLYKALYEPFDMWVRPYEMFMSKVDVEKYPEIQQEYRFDKVDETIVKQLLSQDNKKFEFEDLQEKESKKRIK